MSPAMQIVLNIVNGGLLLSLFMVTYRLVRGPSLPDRAVAGDLVSLHVVALIAIRSVLSNQPTLIDLVLVFAVMGFISTAVVGVYIERSKRGKARVGASEVEQVQ